MHVTPQLHSITLHKKYRTRIHLKFLGLYNQQFYLQCYDIIFSQYNISNLSDLQLKHVRSLYKSLFHRIIIYYLSESFLYKQVLEQCFCN